MTREPTYDPSTRVAVVTGANHGIGLEIARQLATQGIHVILTSRDEAQGWLACQKLADGGLSLGYQQLDVTDPDGIRRLRDFLQREHGAGLISW
jgi:(+)-neomenthol dehydrogenase